MAKYVFDIGERYRFHAASPQVRVWDYIFGLHDAMLAGLAGKKVLYFDTLYWVHLCEVKRGRERDRRYFELLDLLNTLKDEGRIICVASSSLLTEIDLQTDNQSRTVTAELVSRFSDEVCLIEVHGAMRLEFKEHILRCFLREDALSLKSRYFTRPAWVFGVVIPVSEAEDYDKKVRIEKMGADLAWSLSFSRVLMNHSGFKKHCLAAEMADALIRDGHDWLKQGLNYDKVRVNIQSILTERHLKGIWDIFKELQDEYPHLVGKSRESEEVKCKQSIKLMPHVQVLASALSALITNSVSSIKANDVIDMEHAAMALPHCDALFLDRRSANLLNAGRSSIAKKHDKPVLGNIDDVLLYLRRLKSGKN